MSRTRVKKPSRSVALGGTTGTALGAVIEVVAGVAGVPLPVGTGALLGGALAQLFGYFTRGGRKGESD